MTKKEIKTSSNEALIVDYIQTYANYICNYNLQRGIVMLEKHLRDLENELLQRGIFSQATVERFRNL